MPLTVACAQVAPEKANLGRNIDRIAGILIEASSRGVDLVVFPETAVSGYFLEGGVVDCALAKEELGSRLSRKLTELARPIDAVIGHYELDNGVVYNSLSTFSFRGHDWDTVSVYRKFFLATYGVFDEERFVTRGRELGICNSRFGKLGFLICEDVWHSMLSNLLALNGAQIVIVSSASPARNFEGEKPENLTRYERMVKAVSEEHGVFTLNSMLCGFEGGKGLVGGSMIVNPFGRVLGQAPIQEEYLLIAELDLGEIEIARAQAPLIADLRSSWAEMKRMVNEVK